MDPTGENEQPAARNHGGLNDQCQVVRQEGAKRTFLAERDVDVEPVSLLRS